MPYAEAVPTTPAMTLFFRFVHGLSALRALLLLLRANGYHCHAPYAIISLEPFTQQDKPAFSKGLESDPVMIILARRYSLCFTLPIIYVG